MSHDHGTLSVSRPRFILYPSNSRHAALALRIAESNSISTRSSRPVIACRKARRLKSADKHKNNAPRPIPYSSPFILSLRPRTRDLSDCAPRLYASPLSFSVRSRPRSRTHATVTYYLVCLCSYHRAKIQRPVRPDVGQGSSRDGFRSTGQGSREIILSNFPRAIR